MCAVELARVVEPGRIGVTVPQDEGKASQRDRKPELSFAGNFRVKLDVQPTPVLYSSTLLSIVYSKYM